MLSSEVSFDALAEVYFDLQTGHRQAEQRRGYLSER